MLTVDYGCFNGDFSTATLVMSIAHGNNLRAFYPPIGRPRSPGQVAYLLAGKSPSQLAVAALYVVITAGGHGALGTRYGDETIAFALPETR